MADPQDIKQLVEKVRKWAYNIPSITLTPDVEEAEQFSSLALVGLLISFRLFKTSVLKRILQRVWRVSEASLDVTYISCDTFLFSFQQRNDQDQV